VIKLKSLLSEVKPSMNVKDDIPLEEVEKAKQLLYRFFKERDTLSWLLTYDWTLTSAKTGWSWIDGERYSFDYIPKRGRSVQRPAYPGADYTRTVKSFRTPKDAVDYFVAGDMIKYGDRYVFRGMNMAEWIQAKKQGFIKSNAKYNLGGIEFTYFGKDWATAHSYAGGFAPFDKEPTRPLPGVIVAVPKELTKSAKDVTGQTTDNEYVAEKIPLNQVQGVWYIVPLEVGSGFLEIVLKDGSLDRGSASPPYSRFAIVPKAGVAL
jgi:hypothetical protein